MKFCRAYFAEEHSSATYNPTVELPLDERTALLHELTSNFSYSENQVYVLTPGGDVEVLSTGSTPIDFAYKVHTDIGHHCSEAKINGRKVALNTILKNGDTVEIITRKNARPKAEWLRKPKDPNSEHPFVRSKSARNKIRNWFKKQSYEESIARGAELLKQELGKSHEEISFKSEFMLSVANSLNCSSLEGLFAALGYGGTGQVTLQKVLNEIIKVKVKYGRDFLIQEIGRPNVDILEKLVDSYSSQEKNEFFSSILLRDTYKSFQDFLVEIYDLGENLLDQQTLRKLSDKVEQLENDRGLVRKDHLDQTVSGATFPASLQADSEYIRWIIGGESGLPYRFASCCKVHPFGKNIGTAKRGGTGFVIHSNKCKNLKNVSENRRSQVKNAIDIEIKSQDRVGMERDISFHFAQKHLNIREAHVKTYRNNEALFTKSVTVESVEDVNLLKEVLLDLQKLNDIMQAHFLSKEVTEYKIDKTVFFEEK